jgi:hypothetical protein
MPRRRMRGGDTDMFGNFVEDAALVGVGAYAARNPNTPGMGIVANIGKFFLYAIGTVFILVALFFAYAMIFGKHNAPPATKEHLSMQCRPEDKPEERGGQVGCLTGSGNWYASST